MADDHVSSILEQWQRVRPELDVGPMGTVGRLSRLARDIEHKLDQNFARFDLDTVAFDLLAALRRQGDPYTLSPKALQFEMMISSGSTTYRIDRLEQRGLVARQPDPDDRRATQVRLTSEGLSLIDKVVASHVQLEATYLSALSNAQQRKLEELLTLLTQARGL
jgi:DNA-binding MarR family transcriptional regulator